MSIAQTIKHEAKELASLTLFFFSGFLLITVIFKLLLDEYDVQFDALAKALFGGLVLAKVVLLLRNRSFMRALSGSRGVVRVLYKTAIYMVGVFVVLVVEKTLEAYGEAGGLGPAFQHVLETRRLTHVLAVTLLVSSLIAAFNCKDELAEAIGRDRLLDVFFRKPGPESS